MHPVRYDLPLCPVDGCPQPHAEDVWSLVNTPSTITLPAGADQPPPLDALDTAITAMVVDRARRVDNLIRAHLQTHDVIEFVRTIHRLQCELDSHRRDIRPHTYPQPDPDLARRLTEFRQACADATTGRPSATEDTTAED